jgi:predicted flap endonuclease-1-like 5' DNA nuclease
MAEAAKTPVVDVEKTFSFPVGALSPLWLTFAGAAATGAAFFWMTRWLRPANLEAQLAADLPSPALAPLPIVEPVASEAIIEATALVEPAAEVAQTAAQTAVETAMQRSAALVEAFDPVDPVVDAAPVEAAAQTAVQSASAMADDLTRLVGVGPKLAASLAERGVTTFAQLAAWTDKDLQEVDQALSLKGRAVRDAWVAQARRFAEAAA